MIVFKSVEEGKKAIEALQAKLEKLSADPNAKADAVDKLSKEIEDAKTALQAAENSIEKSAQVNLDKAARGDAHRTKEALEKQKTTSVFVPVMQGEPDIMEVTLNGVRYEIPRGRSFEVPFAIAEIVRERLESDANVQRRSKQMQDRLVSSKII
jgi:hypothetical protein